MAVIGPVAKLAENVVGRTVHMVVHPVETVTGVVRGAAHLVAGGSSRADEDSWTPPERPAAMPDLAPPLPRQPSDPVFTEPKAPSRAAEHGGPGDDSDDWRDELEEAPDLAVGEHPQHDTEPLMDPSLTKKVKAEAETLERAADPRKE